MIIATHNATFHADDVFGAALLLQLYPNAEVVRTRDPAKLAQADIVFDVGGVFDPTSKRFDHHQLGAPARPSGITYSSFGLLWQEYGGQFAGGDDVWRRIDERFVQAIDAQDNAQDLYTLTDYNVTPAVLDRMVQLFNPLSLHGNETHDQQFVVAVRMATQILLRLRQVVSEEIEAEQVFLQAYQVAHDRRYVTLDRYVPHKSIAVSQPELLYVLFPDSDETSWRIAAVPEALGSFRSRQALPEAWRGLRDAELEQTTGVAGVTFCHKNGHMAATTSRQTAEQMVKQALALNVGLVSDYTR